MDNLLKSLWTNVSPYFSDSSSKIQSKFEFEFWIYFLKNNPKVMDYPSCSQDQISFYPEISLSVLSESYK